MGESLPIHRAMVKEYTYNVGVGKPGLVVEVEKNSASWDGDDESVEGTDDAE